MSDKVHVSNGGVGFTGLLTIVFVLLKVFGFINWSWWLVFAPVLVSTGLVLSILLICALVLIIAAFKKEDR